jgi:deoxycytidine triphosphate deaminase
MVLSDIEIRAEISAERLIFDPPIPVDSERFGSSAVDLLLHEELLILQYATILQGHR